MKRITKKASLPEVWLHTLVHFVGVLIIVWLAVVPPLWVSIVAMVVEKLQMDLLGHCFLTNFAHQRGVMRGMTYWEFVTNKLGFKNYKRAGHTVDSLIKFGIIGILLFRLAAAIFHIFTGQ